jgi:hypothetical protein
MGDGAGDAACMADVVIDLEQWRRARRLLPILVDRHGLAFFLDEHAAFPRPPRLSTGRIERCVEVAAQWIERRTGRAIDDEGRVALRRLLVRHLDERLRGDASLRRR